MNLTEHIDLPPPGAHAFRARESSKFMGWYVSYRVIGEPYCRIVGHWPEQQAKAIADELRTRTLVTYALMS